MHIGIDARFYGTRQRGIGRYVLKLIEALEQIDSRNQYLVFLRRENFDEYIPQNKNFQKKLWDVPWYGLKEQIVFPRVKIDLMHFPHWNVPIMFASPFVLTVHDLILFSSSRLQEATTRGRLFYDLKFAGFKFVFSRAVKKAKAIIVPSSFVKEQLLSLYPSLDSKVQVIYEAPTIEKLEAGNGFQIQDSKFKIPNSRFVLYVGAAYPHKNLMRLVRAWQRLPAEVLREYKLVLVGRPDFFWERLQFKIQDSRFKIPDSVVFYGAADDAELASLYKNASLLIQPSLEEGFSLSPLEALSFDCPVAVSDIPVHREVLGGAAIFFNPHDENSITSAIKDALLNPQIRENILSQAKQILPKYSWQKTAQATLDIIEKM